MKYLSTINPVRTLDIWEDFDRMFDNVWTGRSSNRVPAVDVKENADGYVLEAELPGLTEKDVEVKVEDNLLTISSVKNAEKEEKKDGYLIRERSCATFRRSFVLPKDADREGIKATFKNGLLELAIAKLPETKPRSIEIKVAK